MDELDRAARRTAINLMRLNEAVDHLDAETYPTLPKINRESQRMHRHRMLDRFYRKWFESKGGTE